MLERLLELWSSEEPADIDQGVELLHALATEPLLRKLWSAVSLTGGFEWGPRHYIEEPDHRIVTGLIEATAPALLRTIPAAQHLSEVIIRTNATQSRLCPWPYIEHLEALPRLKNLTVELATLDRLPHATEAVFRSCCFTHPLTPSSYTQLTFIQCTTEVSQSFSGPDTVSFMDMELKGWSVQNASHLEIARCTKGRDLRSFTGTYSVGWSGRSSIPKFPDSTVVLRLGSNQFYNLKHLSRLQKLRFLDLGGCVYPSLAPLADLPALRVVRSVNGQVVDVSPLSANPELYLKVWEAQNASPEMQGWIHNAANEDAPF